MRAGVMRAHMRALCGGGRGVILAHAIYGGIYSDMAGGAGRGIIWRGRLYLLNGGAGARF